MPLPEHLPYAKPFPAEYLRTHDARVVQPESQTIVMDDELQPRVDSAYLAKTFLTNLQGPKEDFLMDSREISPQQIASLSRTTVDLSLRCDVLGKDHPRTCASSPHLFVMQRVLKPLLVKCQLSAPQRPQTLRMRGPGEPCHHPECGVSVCRQPPKITAYMSCAGTTNT